MRLSDRNARLALHTIQKAPDAIIWTCPEGSIKHINEEAARRLEYPPEELLHENISRINPEFDADKLRQTWQVLREQGAFQAESVHYSKSGRPIPVEIVSHYVQFDGMEYTCSIVRDVTERRRKEAALRGALLEIRELKQRLQSENDHLKEQITRLATSDPNLSPDAFRDLVERVVVQALYRGKFPEVWQRERASHRLRGEVQSLAAAQRAHILRALRVCSWKISGPGGAAELLEIKPTTLQSRMKKLDIRRSLDAL